MRIIFLIEIALFCLCNTTTRTAGFSTSTSHNYKKTLIFLYELPTPSLLVDLITIETICGSFPNGIPTLCIGDWLLQPTAQDRHHNTTVSSLQVLQQESPQHHDQRSLNNLEDQVGDVCFAYIHTRVLESRCDGQYLAKLDLPTGTDAYLVLGLNNHHVISYYWARSAGAGAAMEAPGIALRDNRLEWDSVSGKFTDCNSNDGKRSEWVNFLQPGDQIQLRPNNNLAQTIQLFQERIYGISSAGRPLGSEPIVVCRFEATLLLPRASNATAAI